MIEPDTDPEIQLPPEEPPPTNAVPIHQSMDVHKEIFKDLEGKLGMIKGAFATGRRGGVEGMSDGRKALFETAVQETADITPDMWTPELMQKMSKRFPEALPTIRKIVNYRSQMQQALEFHEDLAKKKQS